MVPSADSGVTVLRREAKLLLERDESEALAHELGRTAAPVESRIVTVYFDRPDGVLARRAVSTPEDCVKVRARTYEPDRGPGRTGVVLEVKRERSGVTTKQRVRLARDEVRAALDLSIAPALGPLAPTVGASFRRRVFQCSPDWRVTFDDGLSFHDAGWELLDAPAWGAALPPPFAAEPRVVVEVKHGPEGLPRWLAALSRSARPYSKFGAAMAGSRRRSCGA